MNFGSVWSATDEGAIDEAVPAARVEWTTSRMVGSPEPPLPYRVERVFPQQDFKNPVYAAQEPGTERLMVAELEGKIFAIDDTMPDSDSRELFLDVKRQIYAFSFHPQYEQNGIVIVFMPKSAADSTLSCVSRFRATGVRRRVDPSTEEVLITWPAGGHNGGEAIYGPDGYLYVSTGDGTGGSDPNKTGQGVNDLHSVIMRIDVDRPDNDRPYSVPADNPFVSLPDARPEIWAFGFRNPWRMSFDRDGRLWVGDVGQDLWEMIYLAKAGGNYGWSVREGTHPFHPQTPSGPGPIVPPVIEHSHLDCRSITGGYVYEGRKLPALQGAYLYGDYQYGKIWGLRWDGQQVTWSAELADSALQIASFALGRRGEFYIVDHLGGGLFELVPNESRDTTSQFPRRLSDTGIFSDVATHRLAPGVVAYDVNTPQWLDGAVATRFFALAPDTTIRFVEKSTDANTWTLADNSITGQTIWIPEVDREKIPARRLETRIMVKQDDHWQGYSYVWNEEQTEAVLVPNEGMSLQRGDRTWEIPSRNDCMACHSRAAGFVLGINTLQMNRESHERQSSLRGNQLSALSQLNYFDRRLDQPIAEFPQLPNAYGQEESLDARARAYLHVNCSACHVSDGGGNARFQVRYDLPFQELRLLDEQPIHGTFGLTTPRLIAAGDPYNSVLFYRMSKIGPGHMPHLGAQSIDPAGLKLMHDWIHQLVSSDEASKSVDGANSLSPQETSPGMTADLSSLATRLATDEANATNDIVSSPSLSLMVTHAILVGTPELAPYRERLIEAGVEAESAFVRDLYERFIPARERTQRVGPLVNREQILDLRGDPERGRDLFFASGTVQCAQCHQIDGRGGKLGPDLTSIGTKYSPRQILDALVEPSQRIDDAFKTTVVVDHDGAVVTGLIVREDDDSLTIARNEAGETVESTIQKDKIEERITQPISLMPEQLLRDLTPQQAADLVTYLSQRKSSE